jgi:hypothetical protein
MKISRDSSRTPRLAGLDFCELGRLPDANGDSGSHGTERFCAWQLDLDNERTVERFTEPGRVDDNQWAWFGIFTGALWRYLNKGEKTDECSDNKKKRPADYSQPLCVANSLKFDCLMKARLLDRNVQSSKMVHAALLLLMLEAVFTDLVSPSA